MVIFLWCGRQDGMNSFQTKAQSWLPVAHDLSATTPRDPSSAQATTTDDTGSLDYKILDVLLWDFEHTETWLSQSLELTFQELLEIGIDNLPAYDRKQSKPPPEEIARQVSDSSDTTIANGLVALLGLDLGKLMQVPIANLAERVVWSPDRSHATAANLETVFDRVLGALIDQGLEDLLQKRISEDVLDADDKSASAIPGSGTSVYNEPDITASIGLARYSGLAAEDMLIRTIHHRNFGTDFLGIGSDDDGLSTTTGGPDNNDAPVAGDSLFADVHASRGRYAHRAYIRIKCPPGEKASPSNVGASRRG